MLPAGLTISALMTDAGTVVAQFGTLITLVAGLGIGFFVVGWIISKVKTARR